MPVPKKRQSKSKTNIRKNIWKKQAVKVLDNGFSKMIRGLSKSRAKTNPTRGATGFQENISKKEPREHSKGFSKTNKPSKKVPSKPQWYWTIYLKFNGKKSRSLRQFPQSDQGTSKESLME